MRFPLPTYPCEFEIPDDWLAEAGFADWTPSGPAFKSKPGAELVLLREIEPPCRYPEYPKDHRGFDRGRLVKVLCEISCGEVIWPVPLLKLPEIDSFGRPYRYRVLDGLHRFYGAVAAGFTHLPGEFV